MRDVTRVVSRAVARWRSGLFLFLVSRFDSRNRLALGSMQDNVCSTTATITVYNFLVATLSAQQL